MWVFTEHGYYSVVADRDQPKNYVWVRARNEEDIKVVSAETGYDYIHIKTADYPWRVKMRHADWAAFVHSTASAIDYPNYKNRVATRDKDRASIYSEVWSVLARRLECGWYGDDLVSENAPSAEDPDTERMWHAEDVLEGFMAEFDYAEVDDESALIDLVAALLRVGGFRNLNISQVLRFAEMHYLEQEVGSYDL